MNKIDKKNIYNRLKESLTPYLKSKGFDLHEILFSYVKDDFVVSWGDIADFESWLTFNPYFEVFNKEIIEILNIVFKGEEPSFISNRTQSTTNFAHEFGVYDFDDSQFNFCAEGVCSYGYDICLEEEDAKVLEGLPILYNVEPIVKDHIAFLEKVAFPYFEKLSTVKGINEYFNTRVLSLSEEDFQDMNIVRSFQLEEVLSAIVAAYLVNDTNLEEIIFRYKKLYIVSEYYTKDINQLVDWINKNKDVKNDTTL